MYSGIFHLAYYFQVSLHCGMYKHSAAFYSWVIFLVVHPFFNWGTFFNLGCFHLLTIMNSGARNMSVHIFIWVPVSYSLGYTPISGIAELHGDSMFSFLRNRQIAFYWMILHSHQQRIRVVVSSDPRQHLLFSVSVFQIQPFKWVWCIISLGFWYAFPWWLMMLSILLAICISLGKFLLKSFAHFSIRFFYIQDTRILPDTWFPNVFSHSVVVFSLLWKYPLMHTRFFWHF